MAFNGSAPERACIIKNISEGGARLDIGLLLDPPDRFSLRISASSNTWRECRVVWRSEFEAGVAHLDTTGPDDHAEPPSGETATLRTLRGRAFPRAVKASQR
jgi:hypothetical protein